MRLFEISGAVAFPDHSVAVTWSDGVSGVVDFLPVIDRGGWFTPLRDGDLFAGTMVVLPDGAGLTWPEEIDYSADFIRRLAFPDGVPADRGGDGLGRHEAGPGPNPPPPA